MDDAGSRRRRGPGIITAVACTECRKKRSKCDGQKPCSRCAAQDAECIYEAPVRQSKETMRNELEQLHLHRRQTERILGAISTPSKSQETFNRLRNGESLEAVAEWLEKSASDPAGDGQSASSLSSPSQRGTASDSLRSTRSVTDPVTPAILPSSGVVKRTFESLASSSNPSESATSETDDAMNWEPDTAQLGKESRSLGLACPLIGMYHGLQPSRSPHTVTAENRSRGQDRLLGPIYGAGDLPVSLASIRHWTTVTTKSELINHFMTLYFCWEYPTFATLSKEHFLTDYLAGRQRYCSPLLVNAMLALGCRFSSIPESRADPRDHNTSGDHYFAEAKRLLLEDNLSSVTSIQALGLMSIREASCGRETESVYYAGQAIRLAVESGLHIEASNDPNSQEMEHDVRAATFWGAFSLDQAWSLSIGKLPHFSRSGSLVNKPAIVEELEANDWVPYTDFGATDLTNASQPSNVRSVYRCFCELSELIHQSLYLFYTPSRNFTGAEVVAVYTRYLNWYSSLPEALRVGSNWTPFVLFVHLFYHYAVLLLLRPFVRLRIIGSNVSPKEVSQQAAEAIVTLVNAYDQLYTLDRTPSFVPLILLAAAITQLEATGRSPAESSLHQMVSCHGFAERAINIIRYFMTIWGSEGPEEIKMQQIVQLCGPSSTSMNFFVPFLIEKSLSCLFSPFPLQGRPFLCGDSDLEQNGFASLKHETL